MLNFINPMRMDNAGSGAFNSPRGGHTHNGVDFRCIPGSELISPIAGHVTKIGYPYSTGYGGFQTKGEEAPYRYLEVKCAKHSYYHRFYYVESRVVVGMNVLVGQVIATMEDISLRYDPKEMQPHVHYERITKKNPKVYMDPHDYHNNN